MALTDRVVLSWNAGPKAKAGQGGPASTRSSALKLTTANITGADVAIAAFAAAADLLSKAVVTRYAFDHGTDLSPTLPTAPQNKGRKWVVSMQETAGNMRFFTHTLPSADDSGGHVIAGTLNADLTNADWVTYATNANGLLTTPDGGAMTIKSATILTRRR